MIMEGMRLKLNVYMIPARGPQTMFYLHLMDGLSSLGIIVGCNCWGSTLGIIVGDHCWGVIGGIEIKRYK